MREQVSWNGWKWDPQIDESTPSGKLLDRLTKAMSSKVDIQECGLLIFGSSPLEFGAGLAINSGDIDITPDQFYPVFGSFLKEQGLLTGDPHIQLCPPGVFRPGQMWVSRSVQRTINGIQVILPHPIDIIAGKLHRLDAKDYQGIGILLEATGRPTSKDMLKYASENPDWLMNGQSKDQRVITNLETFYAYLGGGQLDVENDVLAIVTNDYHQVMDERPVTVRLSAALSRIDECSEIVDPFDKGQS